MEERLGEMRKGRREKIEKGSHCFFKSSGYDKLELNHKHLLLFFQAYRMHYLTPTDYITLLACARE